MLVNFSEMGFIQFRIYFSIPNFLRIFIINKLNYEFFACIEVITYFSFVMLIGCFALIFKY